VFGERRPADGVRVAEPVGERGDDILARDRRFRFQQFAHPPVAVEAVGIIGEAGVLQPAARPLGLPVVGVDDEALGGRDPERLVGGAFERHGETFRVRYDHIVGDRLRRGDHLAHRRGEVGLLQHTPPDERQRQAGLREVAVGAQVVGADGDAGRIEPVAGKTAGFGEGEDIGSGPAADPEDDGRLGATCEPVPRLGVDQPPVGAARRKHDDAGAAVRPGLAGLCGGDEFGAGVDQHDLLDRHRCSSRDALHLLDEVGSECFQARQQGAGGVAGISRARTGRRHARAVEVDAGGDALARRLAVMRAALARRAGNRDQRKRRHSAFSMNTQ
jgi:hypothetical protein